MSGGFEKSHNNKHRFSSPKKAMKHTVVFRCSNCWGINRHSKKCTNKEESSND